MQSMDVINKLKKNCVPGDSRLIVSLTKKYAGWGGEFCYQIVCKAANTIPS